MAPKALNPRTTEYEWGGPFGSTFIVTTLPMTVLALNTACSSIGCSVQDVAALPQATIDATTAAWEKVPEATVLLLAWYAFHAVLYLCPWGRRVQGTELRTGQRLTYNINALHALVISYVLAAVAQYQGWFDLATLADLFFPLALTSCLMSAALAVALYVVSFRPGALLALGGNSGNPIYDFWVGRELNPRIGPLDLKFMFELRPGLIGWTLLNWGFAMKQYQAGDVNISLFFVAVFQLWYVADGLYFEAGNCTMMDIVTDGFGFMLAFGDLAWVPFLYTLQCKFLYHFPQVLPPWYVAVCVVLHLVGYTVFRGANSEKDAFRRDPKAKGVAHLKVMKTSAGKSLIISGFWGICRHPNYVGDWLMTLSWSMLCGGTALYPYFQPVYFAILLIHRQLRDEHAMLHKYGKEDWEKFCKHVPARLIPGVY